VTRDSIVAIVGGPWGVAVTLGLIALLIGREVLGGVVGKQASRWRRSLSIGVAPLLAVFAVVVALRLLGPIQAVLGAATEPPNASPTSVPPTVAAIQSPTVPALAQVSATPIVPTATAVAASVVTPSAVRTPIAPSDGAAVIARVRAAHATVRRGTVETTVDYGGGITAVTTTTFDLGDGQPPPRLLLTTTYQGATGSRTVRRLTIGTQTWQRGTEATWVRQASADDVRAQVAGVLPQLGVSPVDVTFAPARIATLRWYEAARDTDSVLQVDAATGVPQEERRTIRAGGPTVVVRYSNWDGPVDFPNLAP